MKHVRFASRATHLSDPLPVSLPEDMVELGGGSAYPDMLPDVSAEAARVAREYRTEALQYGPLMGLTELRDELTRYLALDGIKSERDNVLILNGAKQALDLLLRVLIDKGDTVIVSRPTYLSALKIIRNHEAAFLEVDIDENGMKVDELEVSLKKMRQLGQKMPKLLFEMPDFHNPTGLSLAQDRRRKLVELAEEFDFYILEDDPYRRLRFEGKAIPPVKVFDKYDRVVGAGTVSKILSPGIRVGWANGNPTLIRRMAALKSEGGCCPLTQRIVLELLQSGAIAQHIAKLAPVMQRHRDAMMSAFQSYLPDARFCKPEGGYFLWIHLANINTDKTAAMAEQNGVSIFPGSLFFAENPQTSFARLAYSFCNPERIAEGVKRLAEAVKRQRNTSLHSPNGETATRARHFD